MVPELNFPAAGNERQSRYAGEKGELSLKGENEWIKMQDKLGRFVYNRGLGGTGIRGLGLARDNPREH